MLNKVILMGRLTKDPELRQTSGGLPVCSFTVAVDRKFARQGEERKADFFNCTAWRQQGEFVSKYFRKGNMINVVGSLQNRQWDDANGVRHYATDVVVDEVNFTGEKAANAGAPQGGYSPQGGYGAPQQQRGNASGFNEPPMDPPFADDGFETIDTDDDLPF